LPSAAWLRRVVAVLRQESAMVGLFLDAANDLASGVSSRSPMCDPPMVVDEQRADTDVRSEHWKPARS
jgi:hypothetical protein